MSMTLVFNPYMMCNSNEGNHILQKEMSHISGVLGCDKQFRYSFHAIFFRFINITLNKK